ncbi:MAG: hypothetical protein WBQ23_04545 [Bacteroidota bacterium]
MKFADFRIGPGVIAEQADIEYIPSGIYTGYPRYEYEWNVREKSAIEQTSIMSVTALRESVQEVSRVEYLENGCNKILTIAQSDIDSFSGALVKIGEAISSADFDVVVAPLRGGYKPSIFASLISGKEQLLSLLPFTNHSNMKNFNAYVLWMKEVLEDRGLTGRALRMCIIDTAHMGNGVFAMLKLLENVKHDLYSNNNIYIEMHLLESEMPGSVMSQIQQYARRMNQKMSVQPVFHHVDSLIIEDNEAALGLVMNIEHDDSIIIKPTPKNGEFLLRKGGTVIRIESENMSYAFSKLVMNAIDEDLQTSDNYTLMQQRIWELSH